MNDSQDLTAHCFFGCGHVESGASPEAVHDAMELHYSAKHAAALLAATPQAPSRADSPGHRPQDTLSMSRADGRAPGLATTGAPDGHNERLTTAEKTKEACTSGGVL